MEEENAENRNVKTNEKYIWTDIESRGIEICTIRKNEKEEEVPIKFKLKALLLRRGGDGSIHIYSKDDDGHYFRLIENFPGLKRLDDAALIVNWSISSTFIAEIRGDNYRLRFSQGTSLWEMI